MNVPIYLQYIAWCASGISVVGVLLNAYKNIWCWPVWCIGNSIWIYYNIATDQWPQVILWIAFTIANVFAWYKWSKDEVDNFMKDWL